MNLTDPVEKLPLVGPAYAKRLQKLNIKTIFDLLYHLPFRYDDFSLISPINRVQAGETVTIRGKIESFTSEYAKNGKLLQKAIVADDSGQIELVWFNQPFLAKVIKTGQNYYFAGQISWFGKNKIMVSPEYELANKTTIHTGRLVPVYPETAGISSKWLRSRLKQALEIFGSQINEFLPKEILQAEKLISEAEALQKIHFPENKTATQQARQRLAFDELYLLQLAALLRKKEWESPKSGQALKVDQAKIAQFKQNLPFTLTLAQERVIKEILEDLQKDKPMNRLLEGDVGSGKTIVASLAAYVAALNDRQTLFMAPTEILAQQHFKTLKGLLEPLGVSLEIVTGSSRKSSTLNLQSSVVIGTHSLLYQNFNTSKVGLVVIDEQHRFGVEQRALLAQKGIAPHFLTMTATPIPRSIALTLFGDLDLSVIDELPAGRIKVKTWVVPQQKRADCYAWIRSQIKNTSQQAFIICPLIEESESLKSVKAAKKEFEILAKEIFPDLRLGLLHGQNKAQEKEKILTDFKEGKLDILVATPVVEVGIDIPRATIMLIEAADRFGLAQLHQLRGRVGRSNLASYCFLFTENENPKVIDRLKTLERTNLGMELAEIDLRLRGPGEIYGTRQHGFPDLKIASLTDVSLISRARKAAEKTLTANLFNQFLQSRLEKYKISTVNN